MISAKLIKSLERKGFSLEFPEYESNEEIIIDILKENNLRLNTALLLFLDKAWDYKRIVLKLNSTQRKNFNKIIILAEKIYSKERIETEMLEIIKKNKIKSKYSINELKEYSGAFKEILLKKNEKEQTIIEKQSKLRLNLDLNKSLSVIFSPAKIRIMGKVFNHEPLTNTELKYYYKAISNIDKSILNPSLQDYLRIIEITKKIIQK